MTSHGHNLPNLFDHYVSAQNRYSAVFNFFWLLEDLIFKIPYYLVVLAIAINC